MTDDQNVSSAGADKKSTDGELQSSADLKNSNDVANQDGEKVLNSESTGKKEKLLTQSEVDRLVYAKKMEERERLQRESEANANKDKSLKAETSNIDPNSITMSRDDLRKAIQEESTRIAMQNRAEDTVKQFSEKVLVGMKKHDDYEAVVSKLGIPNMSGQEVEAFNNLPNTADVLYELGKNPAKFSNVLTLMGRSPRLAYEELCRLSDSIKKNEDALAQNSANKVNEPLDQVKPTNIGAGNGKNPSSVSDFRKLDFLRG